MSNLHPHSHAPNQSLALHPQLHSQAQTQMQKLQQPSHKNAPFYSIIRLLSVNDVYTFRDVRGMGGYPAIKTLVDRYRLPHSLFLVNGDVFGGSQLATAFNGESAADILNAVGCDMMTIGNHEFDYGSRHLVHLMECCEFPCLGSNIRDTKGHALALLEKYSKNTTTSGDNSTKKEEKSDTAPSFPPTTSADTEAWKQLQRKGGVIDLVRPSGLKPTSPQPLPDVPPAVLTQLQPASTFLPTTSLGLSPETVLRGITPFLIYDYLIDGESGTLISRRQTFFPDLARWLCSSESTDINSEMISSPTFELPPISLQNSLNSFTSTPSSSSTSTMASPQTSSQYIPSTYEKNVFSPIMSQNYRDWPGLEDYIHHVASQSSNSSSNSSSTPQPISLNLSIVRLGVFGLCTVTTPFCAYPGPEVQFEDSARVGAAHASLLRKLGCDIVVAATHLTIDEDSELLRTTSDIDIVLGGHEHTPMVLEVNEHWIIKTGQNANNLGVCDLVLEISTGTPVVTSTAITPTQTPFTTHPHSPTTVAIIPTGSHHLHTAPPLHASHLSQPSEIQVHLNVSPVTKTKLFPSLALRPNVGIPPDANVTERILHWEKKLEASLNAQVDTSRVLTTLSTDLVTITQSLRTRETNSGNMVADSLFSYFDHFARETLKTGTPTAKTETAQRWTQTSLRIQSDAQKDHQKQGKDVEESSDEEEHRDSRPKLRSHYVDFAIINGGYVRGDTQYDAGTKFTLGQLMYELPFKEVPILAELKGKDLLRGVERQLSFFPKPAGAFPHFSEGVTVRYNPS